MDLAGRASLATTSDMKFEFVAVKQEPCETAVKQEPCEVKEDAHDGPFERASQQGLEEPGGSFLPALCSVDLACVKHECEEEASEELPAGENLIASDDVAASRRSNESRLNDEGTCVEKPENISPNCTAQSSCLLRDALCTFKKGTLHSSLRQGPCVTNEDHVKPSGCTTESPGLSGKNVQDPSPTTNRSFSCIICSAVFSRRSDLKDHTLTHTVKRPFTCVTCSATFSNISILRQHILIHTGEKPFTCRTCSAKFRHNSTLTKHLRIHTGEKPYSCGFCSDKFRQRPSLNKHLLLHKNSSSFVHT